MNITENTKINDLMKKYPWLLDEVIKIDERVKIVKRNPLAKMFLKNATIKGVSELAGMDVNTLIEQISNLIEQREA